MRLTLSNQRRVAPPCEGFSIFRFDHGQNSFRCGNLGPPLRAFREARKRRTAVNSLQNKLHPIRFGQMSGSLAAVLSGILETDSVGVDGQPCGEVIIEASGEVLANGSPIGSAARFEKELRSVLKLAHLDDEERTEFDRLYALKVKDRRPETRVGA